ncbi:MAG: hypothetical protein IJX58_05780 [Clostridia bacterium]|nr:hypothetical protein [Clostridia bacterium]
MKKLISFLLVLCMCLSVGVMLTACGGKKHTHRYKTEWSKDETHHWHACEGDEADRGCDDIIDKAEHAWNDGEITTPATVESDGIKTFTCTVCAQTKTESIQLKTTVTEAEWNLAFEMNNFTVKGFVTERGKQEGLLMKITDSAIYTENDGYTRFVVKKDDGWHMTNGTDFGPVMNGVSASVRFAMMSFHLPEYADFTYDEESKSYLYVKSDSSSGFYKFNVYFENGVIVKIDGEEDAGVGVTHSFDFENYGTTVVDIPTVNTNVTEEEWKQAFLNAAKTNNLTYTWHQINQKGQVTSDDGFIKVHKDGNEIFMEGACGADGADCYILSEENIFYHYTRDEDNVWSRTQVETLLHIPMLADVLTPFSDLRNSFTFDEAKSIFSATSIEVMGVDMDVDVRIEDGNLTYLRFKIFTDYSDNQPTWITTIYEFTEYGTTNVTLPNISQ